MNYEHAILSNEETRQQAQAMFAALERESFDSVDVLDLEGESDHD